MLQPAQRAAPGALVESCRPADDGLEAALLHRPRERRGVPAAQVLPAVEDAAALGAELALGFHALLVRRGHDRNTPGAQEAVDLAQRRTQLIVEQVLDHLDAEDGVVGRG